MALTITDPKALSTDKLAAYLRRLGIEQDAAAFAQSIGFEPDPWQAKLLRSKSKRRILNCSRQVGKSSVTAIAVLHKALFTPDSMIVLISPTEDQSAELFRKMRDALKQLPEDLMPKLFEDNSLSCEFENGSRIVARPGSEKSSRGFSGVTMLVADEASRIPDPLYFAILPMLMAVDGELWVLSTPFGKRGFFYEEFEHGEGWDRYRVPASQCPRFNPETLQQMRRSMGARFFEQEFNCEFVDLEDSVFSTELINSAFDDTIKPLFGEGVVSPVLDEMPTLELPKFGED